MALTRAEAGRAFRILTATIRERGFAWVVTQVEETIALGKVRTKKLCTREVTENVDEVWEVRATKSPPSRGQALFAVAEWYPSAERLDVLFESITLAAPVVSQIAHETLSGMENSGVRVSLASTARAAGDLMVRR